MDIHRNVLFITTKFYCSVYDLIHDPLNGKLCRVINVCKSALINNAKTFFSQVDALSFMAAFCRQASRLTQCASSFRVLSLAPTILFRSFCSNNDEFITLIKNLEIQEIDDSMLSSFASKQSTLINMASRGDPANDIRSFAEELGIKSNFSIGEIQTALIAKYQPDQSQGIVFFILCHFIYPL